MVDMEKPAPRARWGCLKLTCGGCVVLVVAGVFVAVAVWHMLTHWDTGKSAWEHLPPSTVMAVEGYDINGLLNHAVRDPGAVSLLRVLAREYADEPIDIVDGKTYTYGGVINDMVQSYADLGKLHTAVLPNIALCGLGGPGGDDFFAILRPTTWMRWADGGELVRSGPPRNLGNGYTTAIDGWVLFAETRDLAQEMVDNWQSGHQLFGAAPKPAGPYLAAGVRRISTPSPAAGRSGSEPLAFADPFAPAAVDNSDHETAVGYDAARLLLTPSSDGWLALGGIVHERGVFNVSWGGEATVDESDKRPYAGNVFISAQPAPAQWNVIRKALADAARAQENPATPNWRRLLAQWLWNGWWDNASGEIVLLADSPARAEENGIAPLPVFTMGWTLASQVDEKLAAEKFQNAFSLFLDSATAPGGNPMLQAVKDSVEYQPENRPDGQGGRLHLPPVLVNAAQPAWFFPFDAAEASGWLASDPTGLANIPSALSRLRSDPLRRTGPRALVTARWDISENFRQALKKVIQERLAPIPATHFGSAERFVEYGVWLDNLLAAYPGGSLDARVDADLSKTDFAVWIPFGQTVY